MPPATQIVRRAGQLPVETTGFVGRRSELTTLGSLLSGSRLVTVTGAGGVGKTRLALRAASGAAARYRHGVVLAELAGLRDPELLPHAVASALGLSQQDSRTRMEAVTGYLRQRESLLILDTCEHVVDECALFVEAVLREAPDVTILATSRQPLDVPGESTFPLSPLQVPEPGAAPVTGDAVELFAQRAVAAMADFEVTRANQERVIQLCRQLDGIPLAIELAAVRLRALDLDELARRLDRRLKFLAGGRRGSAPRHQSLRDTIGWSYELCDGEEQVLWARLSVFAGPFSVQAAEDTCAGGDLPRDAVFPTLISLVEKSVLIRDDGPVPCYRMLDTIREYGTERLAGTAERDQIRKTMIRHYLRVIEELDADPLTDQLTRYRTLRAQHASLIAALDYCLTVPGLERTVARLVMAAYWYILISGAFQEATHYLTKVLERFPGPSAERAGLLTLHGLLATATAAGDPGTGLAECEEGLAMAEALGASRIHARGHLYYCQALMAAGRPGDAIAAGLTARDLMARSGDTATAEALWLYLGVSQLLTGDIGECYASSAQGLRQMPADGSERWLSSFLYVMSAVVLALRGEHEQASLALRKSLVLRQELGDPMGIAYCLGLLGFVAAGQGRPKHAAWLMGTASPVWESLGTEPFTGVPGLADLVREAEIGAREELGADAWDEIFRAAAVCPLDETVALAARNGELPLAAIGRAAAGTAAPTLTNREQEIALLVADGLSNREIAERLVISKRTVDSHVEHIFGKLGVSSRVQLAVWVRQHQARWTTGPA